MTNNDSDLGSNDTTSAKRPNTKRTALIIGGGVLAAAVLIGGGVALGAGLADDDDDRRVSDTADLGDQATGQDDTTNGETSPGGGPSASADAGTADADEINDVIATAAAVAASDGLGGVATDVDATNVGGWDVQFEAANGDETTVSVDADGAARVSDTDVADGDDQGPAGELDAATVESIVAAALGESDGVITDISIDDDGRSPYDVTVLRADRTTVEIDLAADFSVLASDVDTDD